MQVAAPASSWQSYSLALPMGQAALSGSWLWASTPSGLIALDGDGHGQSYGTEDGLESAAQSNVLSLPDGGVLAVSAWGIIARRGATGSFQVVNRSYVSSGRLVLEGKARLAWPILVLPFKGALALFDLRTGRSLLTWTQLGNRHLESASMRDLLVAGDSLYVSLGDAVYKRHMDWDSLTLDRKLADPASWQGQALPSGVDSARSLVWRGDSLAMMAFEGSLAFDSEGRETSACADSGCVVRVRGAVRADSVFYTDGKPWVRQILTDVRGRTWFIGKWQALVEENGVLRDPGGWGDFPFSLVHTLSAVPGGGVVAWSLGRMIRFGEAWGSSFAANSSPYPDDNNQNANQPMKSLTVANDGSIVAGTWGAGVVLMDGMGNLKHWLHPDNGSCLSGYSMGSSYTLVRGVTSAPDGSGFLFTYISPGGAYGLGYLSTDGTAQCVDAVGSSSFSGSLLARADADGETWHVYVAWGSSLDPVGEGGVDYYSIPAPATLGGRWNPSAPSRYLSAVGFPRDMGLSPSGNRLWVASASGMGHWEAGDSVVSAVSYLQGYGGGEVMALEVDALENLWVGTLGKGAYKLTMRHGFPDSLVAVNYQSRDGLLSPRVYDIALDKARGEVWFGTDIGVSRLLDAEVRDASDYMEDSAPEVRAYPNPFRPGLHAQCVLDFVSPEATVFLMDGAGNKIRVYSGDDLRGGRVAWDGNSRSGDRVAPGVYHYWVVANGKTARGKILVEY